MYRYYFECDDFNEVAVVEQELEQAGFPRKRIHVYSKDKDSLAKHNVNPLSAFSRSDSLHYAERGLLAGLITALTILFVLVSLNVLESIGSVSGWVVGSVIVALFTWWGGMIGAKKIHYKLKRFEDALNHGEHLLLVDLDEKDVREMYVYIDRHPKLRKVAEGSSIDNPFVAAE